LRLSSSWRLLVPRTASWSNRFSARLGVAATTSRVQHRVGHSLREREDVCAGLEHVTAAVASLASGSGTTISAAGVLAALFVIGATRRMSIALALELWTAAGLLRVFLLYS
jgi:hypothetical protein